MIESIVNRFASDCIYTREDIYRVIAEAGVKELFPGIVFDQVYQALLQRGVTVIFDVEKEVFHLDIGLCDEQLVVNGAYCVIGGKLIYVDHFGNFSLVRDGRTLEEATGHVFASEETVTGLTTLMDRLDKSVYE